MNINCINSNEIMNAKLVQKQTKVLKQIDDKLKSLFAARLGNNPFSIGLDTDEQVATRINELFELKKQCANLESFGQVDSVILDNYQIDYKAD